MRTFQRVSGSTKLSETTYNTRTSTTISATNLVDYVAVVELLVVLLLLEGRGDELLHRVQVRGTEKLALLRR